jgi:glycerophosphoryl diester phosphodiesterase
LPDLDSEPSKHLVPLVSDNWTKHFQWRGQSPINDAERKRLKALVDKAHAQGRKIRFWGIPDTREAWKVMRDAGVDLINTDDLDGLQKFLSVR